MTRERTPVTACKRCKTETVGGVQHSECRCPKCLQVKILSADNFYQDRSADGGKGHHHPVCRQCQGKRRGQYRSEGRTTAEWRRRRRRSKKRSNGRPIVFQMKEGTINIDKELNKLDKKMNELVSQEEKLLKLKETISKVIGEVFDG